MLWKLLTDKSTNKNASESNNSDQIDSYDDVEANDEFNERELNESSPPFPTAMYNVDRPNIPPSEIVDIAPGEDKISLAFT